jgi:osomolarity two-component system response regulator SSK1
MSSSLVSYPSQTDAPELVLQDPAPDDTLAPLPSDSKSTSPTIERRQLISETNKPSKDGSRKQSLFATVDIDVIRALLQDDNPHPPVPEKPEVHTMMPSAPPIINTGMLHRKIWVKKVGSAATLVVIREDDLVDDVKEAILKKYTNNLGRHYDAPDITLRLVPRDKPGERILNPDEGMCRTLDSFYPGGQNVDEAIIIDVPPKRTPRSSPRGMYAPREPQQVHCHLHGHKLHTY